MMCVHGGTSWPILTNIKYSMFLRNARYGIDLDMNKPNNIRKKVSFGQKGRAVKKGGQKGPVINLLTNGPF